MQEHNHKVSGKGLFSSIRSRFAALDSGSDIGSNTSDLGGEELEQARLVELLNLELLDTEPEERFDRITRLASHVFNVPIATIALIDRDRLWFKARTGMSLAEAPRKTSISRFTIEQDGLLLYEDIQADPRFADHPFVTSAPHVRFYAGATLHGPIGHAVGTLCLFDTSPRSFSEHERELLREFARWIEHEFVLNRNLQATRKNFAELINRDPALPVATRTIAYEQLDRMFDPTQDEPRTTGVLYLEVTNLARFERTHSSATVQQTVSEWIRALQAGDAGVSYLARLSDTEFVGAITCEGSSEATRERCVRQLEAAAQAMRASNPSIVFQVFAGLSVFPQHGSSAAELIERARIAHNESGAHEAVAIFSPLLEKRLARENHIRQHFETALADGSIHFNWQPLFDNRTLTLSGFELLARWTDDEIGAIYPDEFIPLAESEQGPRRGLVWKAIETACRQIGAWSRNGNESTPYISVNIPGPEFFEPDFCDLVEQTLIRHRIRGDKLVLELTERSFIDDFEATAATMTRLNKLGVRIAMDDFGTGYSSISYLTQLPLSIVKLDMSLVQRLETDVSARKLMRGIVELAHGQNLLVVAEGVETKAQFKMVQFVGCEYTQGFLLGRPQPQTSAQQLVANQAGLAQHMGETLALSGAM